MAEKQYKKVFDTTTQTWKDEEIFQNDPSYSKNTTTVTNKPISKDDINSLYQKYYGTTDDVNAQKWAEWAQTKGISTITELDNHFKQAVNDDLVKRGMNDVSGIPGASSQEFLANYNILVQNGVNPQQAYERSMKEIKYKYQPTTAEGTPVETPEQKAARLEKEFGDALNPENIQKYTGLVKEMYDPEFNKQAKNIAEQYAGMGRDYKGDAYNRAMAGLGGEYQSKAFGDAINLIQQGVQNKATGAGFGLNYSNLGTGTALQGRQQDYSTLMSLINRQNETMDYNQQAELAKELARMQSGNKTPDWAYWLQPLATIAGTALGGPVGGAIANKITGGK